MPARTYSSWAAARSSRRDWSLGLSLHPVLLGRGPPVLRPFGLRIEPELIEDRPIARECVLVNYRVKN
jgi:hypothetical protein